MKRNHDPRKPGDLDRRGGDPSDPDNRTWPAGEPKASKRRTMGGGMDEQPGRRLQQETGEEVTGAGSARPGRRSDDDGR